MLRLFVLLLLVSGVACATNSPRVYVMPPVQMQHGKPTATGKLHLAALQTFLAGKHVKTVYVDQTNAAEGTVESFVEKNGVNIIGYDVRHLTALTDMLKTRHQSALVVGARPVLPVVIQQIGGQGERISDERYGIVYEVPLDEEEPETTQREVLPPQPDPLAKPLMLRLAPQIWGRHRYQLTVKGKAQGYVIQELLRHQQQLEFTEITLMDDQSVHTLVKTWVDPVTFKPLQVRLSGIAHNKPLDTHLTFVDNHVTGLSDVERPVYLPQGELRLDRWLPALTYEKYSIMLGLPLLDYQQPISFNWINPKNGEIRLISLMKKGEKTLTVPAGTFKTDEVHLVGAVPTRVYYISQSDPQIIQITIPSQSWVLQKVN